MRSPLDALAQGLFAYQVGTAPHRGKHRMLTVARAALGPRRIRLPGGVELPLFVDSTMDASYPRCASGCSPEAAWDLVRGLAEGDCFVDVGANVGFHTVFASRAVGPSGRVLSVEPSTREYMRLRQAIAWNRCENVLTFHAALGAAPAIARLSVDPSHTGLGHVTVEGEGEAVPVVRGDDLLGPFVPEGRRVRVKIDVEGFEGPAIAGLSALLSRPATDTVVVEVGERFVTRGGTPPREVYERMQALGFRPTVPAVARSDQYDEVFVRAA